MWANRPILSGLLGGGCSLLGTAIFMQQPQTQEKFPPWRTVIKSEEADVHLARKVISSVDKTGLNLRLYQYETCPYCCKVRAFLDFFAFSYEVVEVNPVTRSQLKKVAKDYKKVPVLTSSCCEKPLVESAQVISMLTTFLIHEELSFDAVPELYPEHVVADPKSGKEQLTFLNKYFVMFGNKPMSDEQIQNARNEREWRTWVDDHFIHLISPNVYRTLSEALETFHYFDKVGEWERNFPPWERFLAIYVGAFAMWLISKRLKKRHQVDDERAAMRDAFKDFLEHKGPHRKFMGGPIPNLADLALYGAIKSFAGCSTFIEMYEANAELREWYDAMDTAVKEGRGRKLLERKCAALERMVGSRV